MWQYQTIGLLGKKCSFVSAAVEQSEGNWELQRPSTTAALSSSHVEDREQFKSWKSNAFERDREGLQWQRSLNCKIISIIFFKSWFVFFLFLNSAINTEPWTWNRGIITPWVLVPLHPWGWHESTGRTRRQTQDQEPEHTNWQRRRGRCGAPFSYRCKADQSSAPSISDAPAFKFTKLWKKIATPTCAPWPRT